MYPDIPKQEQQKHISTLAKHPQACSFYVPKSYAYEEIDTAYIVCEDDAAFPSVAQHMLIEAARKDGVDVVEETMSAGHFPFLSRPEELAGLVDRLAT